MSSHPILRTPSSPFAKNATTCELQLSPASLPLYLTPLLVDAKRVRIGASLANVLEPSKRECDWKSRFKTRQGNCAPKWRMMLRCVHQISFGLSSETKNHTQEKFFHLSKRALLHGNQAILLQELRNRFQILMGRSSGLDECKIGGLSEVMKFVLKSWHVREPDGKWARYHKLSGCRVNLSTT